MKEDRAAIKAALEAALNGSELDVKSLKGSLTLINGGLAGNNPKAPDAPINDAPTMSGGFREAA